MESLLYVRRQTGEGHRLIGCIVSVLIQDGHAHDIMFDGGDYLIRFSVIGNPVFGTAKCNRADERQNQGQQLRWLHKLQSQKRD